MERIIFSVDEFLERFDISCTLKLCNHVVTKKCERMPQSVVFSALSRRLIVACKEELLQPEFKQYHALIPMLIFCLEKIEDKENMADINRIVDIVKSKHSDFEKSISIQRRMYSKEFPLLMSTTEGDHCNFTIDSLLAAADMNNDLVVHLKNSAMNFAVLPDETLITSLLQYCEKYCSPSNISVYDSFAPFFSKLFGFVVVSGKSAVQLLRFSLRMKNSLSLANNSQILLTQIISVICCEMYRTFAFCEAFEMFLWSICVLGQDENSSSFSLFAHTLIRRISTSSAVLSYLAIKVSNITSSQFFTVQKLPKIVDKSFLEYLGLQSPPNTHLYSSSFLSDPYYIICKVVLVSAVNELVLSSASFNSPSPVLASAIASLGSINDTNTFVFNDIVLGIIESFLYVDINGFSRIVFDLFINLLSNINVVSFPCDNSKSAEDISLLNDKTCKSNLSKCCKQDILLEILLSFKCFGMNVSKLFEMLIERNDLDSFVFLLCLIMPVEQFTDDMHIWLRSTYHTEPAKLYLYLVLFVQTVTHELFPKDFCDIDIALCGLAKIVDDTIGSSTRVSSVVDIKLKKLFLGLSEIIPKNMSVKESQKCVEMFSIEEEEKLLYTNPKDDYFSYFLSMLSSSRHNDSTSTFLGKSQIICRGDALRNLSLASIIHKNEKKSSSSIFRVIYSPLETKMYPLDELRDAPMIADVLNSELSIEIALHMETAKAPTLFVDLIGKTMTLIHSVRSLITFHNFYEPHNSDEFSFSIQTSKYSGIFRYNDKIRGTIQSYRQILVAPSITHVFSFNFNEFYQRSGGLNCEDCERKSFLNNFAYMYASIVLLGYLENDCYFISLFQILNSVIDDISIIMTGREYGNDVQMKLVRIFLGLISRETLKKLELSDDVVDFSLLLPLFCMCSLSLFHSQSENSIETPLEVATQEFCVCAQRFFVPAFQSELSFPTNITRILSPFSSGDMNVSISKTRKIFIISTELSKVLISKMEFRYIHEDRLVEVNIQYELFDCVSRLDLSNLSKHSVFPLSMVAIPSITSVWEAIPVLVQPILSVDNYTMVLLSELHEIYLAVEFHDDFKSVCSFLLNLSWDKKNISILTSSLAVISAMMNNERNEIYCEIFVGLFQKLCTMLEFDPLKCMVLLENCPIEMLTPLFSSMISIPDTFLPSLQAFVRSVQNISLNSCTSIKILMTLTNLLSVFLKYDMKSICLDNKPQLYMYPMNTAELLATKRMKTSTMETFFLSEKTLVTISSVSCISSKINDAHVLGQFNAEYFRSTRRCQWNYFTKSVIDQLVRNSAHYSSQNTTFKRRATDVFDLKGIEKSSSKAHSLKRKQRDSSVQLMSPPSIGNHCSSARDDSVECGTEIIMNPPVVKKSLGTIDVKVISDVSATSSPSELEDIQKAEAWKPSSKDYLAKKFAISF